MNQIHILNGDALKEQLPEQISGDVLVARECLVDGPVNAQTLDELIKIRSNFIEATFGDSYQQAEDQLRKISLIKDGEVNLWFEEDLFCQVNLWFICSLLYLKGLKVSLVMPKDSLRYGFAGLNKAQLQEALESKKELTPINVNQFALLWFAYRSNHIERLLKLGVQMHSDFPFVMRAIEAHFERTPRDGNPGHPERLIRQIMQELSTQDFGAVFREFCDRAPIYGFGDLQVKGIYDQIIGQ